MEAMASSSEIARWVRSRARGISASPAAVRETDRPGPLEEVDAEALFEGADLHADGRLRDADPASGLGEVLRLGCDQEHPEFRE